MNRIYYTKPSITELEIRYVYDAAAKGWGERCYEYIGRFEELFKQHLGVKHAIAASSCTGVFQWNTKRGMTYLSFDNTEAQ